MVVTALACPNSSCTVVPAVPQVSQKGFNILSGPISQRFFRQKIGKVFRPVHIKWRTIRPYPVFLHARPVEPRGQARGTSDTVLLWGDIPAKSWCIHRRLRPWSSAAGISFPKNIAPSGSGDIHDCHHRNPLNVKRLSETEALHTR
jgi:hypothetical protein